MNPLMWVISTQPVMWRMFVRYAPKGFEFALMYVRVVLQLFIHVFLATIF
jgi:hypothetical protein